MKKYTHLIISIALVLLLLGAWIVTLNTQSTGDRQSELINSAALLIEDRIYIRAAALLEEAASINGTHTAKAENKLLQVYFALLETRGFPRKYSELLMQRINRADAGSDVFREAAEYYFSISRAQTALIILKNGIDRTSCYMLIELYESERYAFNINRISFEDVTLFYGDTIGVKMDGKWGVASNDGSILIPCIYDKVSTFHKNKVVVRQNSEIFAVDRNNNRVSVADNTVTDFGNFSQNRVPVLIDSTWRRASGLFEIGDMEFESIGMSSNGYFVAKSGGLYGIIDISTNWLIPPEFDEIITDEFGRGFSQNAVFVRHLGNIYLLVDESRIAGPFEDARPFSDTGFAAVKRNGKWGFIDNTGTTVIDYIFDDADSFSMHLAAVRIGDYWGYISLRGDVVIAPQFSDAKGFSEGSAPVLTQRGWQIITLVEYKRGINL